MKELLFTPGPTEVSPNVLQAMSKPILNPDIDERFFELYDDLCEKIRKIAGTKSSLFIMAGEGMVALDAAVANLVERKEKVLAISSGVFGDGFADFVENYGGRPVVARAEYDDVVSPNLVERELEKNKDISVATFVHCETPSGTVSPLEEIGKVCNDHGVLLIADTVSTLGGMPVQADKNHIDICLGASQKCFSAPPGLAIISVSDRAWEKISKRKEQVSSFYLSLLEWKRSWLGERVFPYTQSVSDVFALNKAVDMILEEGITKVYRRHAKVAEYLRRSCRELGLELFPKSDEISSDTVTAIKVPKTLDEKELRERMKAKYGAVIAGSWGKLSGRVIRLGNMGYNAQQERAEKVVKALARSLKDVGFS
ncbi:MAG: alanine--glyoxylate aminotransferase family protein [Nitrososphaerota archaeon]|nr:alanine--glyoxylate aminotransferase family protein [Nitrososphaerota archaeon]